MTIDIHTHVVPADLPSYPGSSPPPRWPSMAARDCQHRDVIISGKLFRTVAGTCWDVGQRIEAMAAMGIARQVLSPMPELLSYWLDGKDALLIGRAINEAIGAMIDQAPDYFIGLGTVPLLDPDLAILELERLMRDGRFRGVEIGTNVNGISIGDPRFDAFFAAAARLDASIFVHALHPVGEERLIGPAQLKAVVAFPCETALAISSLMTGGMLSRHPSLKLAFSHGGGAFVSVLPRLQHGWKTFPALRSALTESPRDIARRLYYDTLVYDPDTLRSLVRIFGETQLMIGSDFPFDIHDRDPLGSLSATDLPESTQRLLRDRNARRFLGLTEETCGCAGGSTD